MDPLMGAAGAVTTAIGAVIAATQVRRWARNRAARNDQAAERQALLRVIKGFGHDPSKVLVKLVRGGIRQGVQLYTKDGRPLRFYTKREISKLQRSWRRGS